MARHAAQQDAPHRPEASRADDEQVDPGGLAAASSDGAVGPSTISPSDAHVRRQRGHRAVDDVLRMRRAPRPRAPRRRRAGCPAGRTSSDCADDARSGAGARRTQRRGLGASRAPSDSGSPSRPTPISSGSVRSRSRNPAGAMATAHGAPSRTCWPTLPASTRPTTPRWLEPSTIRSASSASAELDQRARGRPSHDDDAARLDAGWKLLRGSVAGPRLRLSRNSSSRRSMGR